MTQQGFGGLQATGITANLHALSTGTELSGTILTWAAISAAPHGDGSVSASTTTGRLTLVPGVYRVDVDLTIENNTVSGLSSEDVTVQDHVTAQLYVGNSSGTMTAIAGTKSKTMLMEGLPVNLHITAFVEITHAMANPATGSAYNFISVWLSTSIVGGTLSDVIISEARFLASRMY